MNKLRTTLLTATMLLAAPTAGVAVTQPTIAETTSVAPGWPLLVQPLPEELRLPNADKAYRIHYTSTNSDGRLAIVSGAIFIPAGTPPTGGWPVVSWAHGTVGVANPCAPSTNGRSQRDIDFLSAWLAAGYAIVASDYEGLGTPGPAPYLHGNSAAYGVIDIVRASRVFEPNLSRRWLAVGQSQGAQAAMFSASLADTYGAGLDFHGATATGLPAQWRTTAEALHVFDPAAAANPFTVLVLAGLDATQPLINPNRYVTPFGKDVLAAARTTDCFTAIAQKLTGKTVADTFAIDAAEQETLLEVLDTDAEIPIKPYAGPVFIGQGDADRVVHPPATQTTADLLHNAGADVTFKSYPGEDHSSTMRAALPDLLAWAADRFQAPR